MITRLSITAIGIVSFVLASGGVMASSAQDKPMDTTQMAQAAPVPAPVAKPAEKSEGSVYGKIYADWYYNLNDTDWSSKKVITKKSEPEITRMYFGYKYKINENFSTDALLDVQRIDPYTASSNSTTNPGSTVKVDSGAAGTVAVEGPLSLKINDSYIAYVKLAAFTWKNIFPTGTLSLGQIGYFAFDLMEGFWGHRYIYKTLMDNESWESSADLGASLLINPIDMLKITLGVTDGDGYKAAQDAFGDYKLGGAVQVNPIKDLTLRVYGDWMPVGQHADTAQSTVSGFAGYDLLKMAKVGLEYDAQFSQKGVKDHDVGGLSIYAMYNIIKQLEIFARFDMMSSKSDWNTAQDGSAVIAGLQYAPVSKVKLALDYQRFTPKQGSLTSDRIYLNGEFDY